MHRALENPVKADICKEFGAIDPKSIPNESTYYNVNEKRKEVIILDYKSVPVPYEYLTDAIKIKNERDLNEFNKIYSTICLKGEPGNPPIYDKIELVKTEKLKLKQGILKDVNIEEVVEVKIQNARNYDVYNGLDDIFLYLGRESEEGFEYGKENKNLATFLLAHFNDVEYKFHNSLKYPGDQFSFNELKDELHRIKKSKKYILIQLTSLGLSNLFYWSEYNFSTNSFSGQLFSGLPNNRFNMTDAFRVKIPNDYAKEFYRSWIRSDDPNIRIDSNISLDKQYVTKERYLKVELLFKVENGNEDKIAWGDCSDNLTYWVKPPLGLNCKVRMDLRRKKLNLIPIRYKFENTRENKVFSNY